MLNTERYQANIKVLAELKSGNSNLEALKSYTGWGGLREAIYKPEVYGELKKMLTQEEIASLKKTLTSAYYTPPEIVKFMYAFLENIEFKGGAILEPAVGNGIFIKHMPENIRKSSRIDCVEIDKITSDICKSLYPDIRLYNRGFEQFHPTPRYDLIIGNPPYGAQTLNDAKHADLNGYCIHHYFTAKCMRLLNEGGILAMVLPAYFMDNESKHVRNIIAAEGGELIAAYRLPDDLFSDAKVTVDIIFLRKGKTQNAALWTKTRKISVAGYNMPLNEYYHQHSHHIIGSLAVVDMYRRKGLTCKKDNGNVFENLYKLINKKIQATEKSEKVKQLKIELDNLLKSIDLLNKSVAAIAQKITELDE